MCIILRFCGGTAVNFVERTGANAISTFKNISGFWVFCLKCLREFLQGSFFNRAAFDVLVMQIFFTAYQLFAFFAVLSAVFGSIFIGIIFHLVKSLGLVQYLGDIIMGIVVLEISPLITVVLLALRSSSAINSEIAVMKVNREIDALESFKIDPVIYLFLPRIISFIISVTLLSSLFAIIVLFSGFLFSSAMFDMSGGIFTDMIAKSITVFDIFLFYVKSVFFGFFISVIPLYNGWRTHYRFTDVPVSVLRGMMGVFMSIVIVEVVSLVARFFLNSL